MSNDESIGKVVDELCLEIRRGFDKRRITKDKENDWLYIALKAGIEPIALIARNEALKEAVECLNSMDNLSQETIHIVGIFQRQILALLTTTPQKASDWQPIESAPKDGTKVILWSHHDVEVGYWSTSVWVKTPKKEGAWIIYENRSDTIELEPTHWMPLPKPPTQIEIPEI